MRVVMMSMRALNEGGDDEHEGGGDEGDGDGDEHEGDGEYGADEDDDGDRVV